jgi:hypothetical protein
VVTISVSVRATHPADGVCFLCNCRHDGNPRGQRSEAAKPPGDQTPGGGIRNQWTAADTVLLSKSGWADCVLNKVSVDLDGGLFESGRRGRLLEWRIETIRQRNQNAVVPLYGMA